MSAVKPGDKIKMDTTKLHTAELCLRHMAPQDMEQVLAIDQASFTMPWPLSAYKFELYENPNSLLLVAETLEKRDSDSQPQIVGMTVLWLILEEAHIATLAVRPDYRRRGIARLLLIKALEEAVQLGAEKATLEVRVSNVIAQKLYQRFGFEIVGHRPRYYRDNNEDAIIMTRNHLGEEYLAWLKNNRDIT
jgi:ribosomal-protein-alanine N-acetyltransferase